MRVFGLPIHLWSKNILKKIEDSCGDYMGLDQKSFLALVLCWARILVRVNGRRLPKTVEVEDGSCKFSL